MEAGRSRRRRNQRNRAAAPARLEDEFVGSGRNWRSNDCVKMKARTRNPMGLLVDALGRGGHVCHGGALRRLSDVDEIEEQRRRRQRWRGENERDVSRKRRGEEIGHGGGLGGQATPACSPRRQQPAWREEDGAAPGPGGLAGPPPPRRQVGFFLQLFSSSAFCYFVLASK